MARTTDRLQLSAMRCNVLQKCGLPDFSVWAVCNDDKYAYYLQKLLANTRNLRNWHQVMHAGRVARGGLRAGVHLACNAIRCAHAPFLADASPLFSSTPQQLLYLGGDGKAERFKDSRLYNFWTKTPLTEHIWTDVGYDTRLRSTRNETLWSMGNK